MNDQAMMEGVKLRPSTEMLRSVRLLSELSEGGLGQLAGFFTAAMLEPGETLYAEGSSATSACILVSGALDAFARLPGGGEAKLGTIAPGAIIGETASSTGGGGGLGASRGRSAGAGSLVLGPPGFSRTHGPAGTQDPAPGHRRDLPKPPETLLHFALRGKGRIGLSRMVSRDLNESYMAIVPAGACRALEVGDAATERLDVKALSPDPGIQKVPAGPAKEKALIVACGMVDVRYGQALDLFHGLDQALVVDLSMVPQVRNAMVMMFDERQYPATGSATMTSALMLQCLPHMFRRLPSEGDRALPRLVALRDSRPSRVIETDIDNPAANHTVESLSDVAATSS